jgi:large subunit ribosomal protein LP2
MKLIAAYALLIVSGNEAPTAEQVTAVVTAAGGEVDEASLASLFADLEGKSIHELLAKGETSLKSCVGSSVAAGKSSCSINIVCNVPYVHILSLFLYQCPPCVAPAAGGVVAAIAAVVEKVKEEVVDALDGGMDMFGGGGGGGGDY